MNQSYLKSIHLNLDISLEGPHLWKFRCQKKRSVYSLGNIIP